ncbi:alpha/beta fold hydrolase [Rhodopseudomonas sp.]|uniref:alpha/beta fold hydrolase n=1 Tax=Rhodopseudomonas sp. TaxID=1078 RepID=UPI003B3B5801
MSKSPILMVHGSWHWGGCFQKLGNILGTQGYPVAMPDLKSHGYSEAGWDSVTSMADYTEPVKELLAAADAPVVLVGHSMGGVALSHLAESMPGKIKCLVYLTAFMTPPGKTANDYIFAYANNPAAAPLFEILTPVGDGAGLALDMAKPDRIRDAFYGDCSDADIRVALNNAAVTNTSVPNVYAPGAISTIARHYITCAQDCAIPFAVQNQMIEDVPGATVHALETSHSPFFSAPQQLAAILKLVAGD